jgi:hypothetical protein
VIRIDRLLALGTARHYLYRIENIVGARPQNVMQQRVDHAFEMPVTLRSGRTNDKMLFGPLETPAVRWMAFVRDD